MAKVPGESRIPVFGKPPHPPMCSKPIKSLVAVEESISQSQLTYPKTRSRFFADSHTQAATNEQGPPKRTKYNRNVNLGKTLLIKPGDSDPSRQLSKFGYMPRAVSNETLNIPGFQVTETGLSCTRNLPKSRFFRHVDEANFSEKKLTAPSTDEIRNTNATGKESDPPRPHETTREVTNPTAGVPSKSSSKLRFHPRTKPVKAFHPAEDATVQGIGRKRMHPVTATGEGDTLLRDIEKEADTQSSEVWVPDDLSNTLIAVDNYHRINPRVFKNAAPSTYASQQELDQALDDDVCTSGLHNRTFSVTPTIEPVSSIESSTDCHSVAMHVKNKTLQQILLKHTVDHSTQQAEAKVNETRDVLSNTCYISTEAAGTPPHSSSLSSKISIPTTSDVNLHDIISNETCANAAVTFTDVPSRYQRPNVLGLLQKSRPIYSPNNEKISLESTEQVNASEKPDTNVWEHPTRVLARVDKTVTADDIGRRVLVGNEKAGILKYFGSVTFESGIWCGVDLDEPEGKNDGTVKGKRYFTCVPQHGLLAPIDKVQILPDVKSSGYTFFESSDTPYQFKLLDKGIMAPDQLPPAATSTPTPSSTTSSQPFWEGVSAHPKQALPLTSTISKQNSFECDESLGILTPDQMKADFTFTTPSEQHVDYMQHIVTSKRFLALDGDNSQSCIMNEELDYDSNCLSMGRPSCITDEAVNPSRGGMVDQAFESDVSEDFLSRALNLSKSDPKVQDVSDRTLSPEDLPMDPPSPHQPLQLKEPVVLPVEDSKVDVVVSGSPGPSSRSQPPPSSFITSITSIGSLDTDGYQGDGELSRPASRNTCTSPTVALMQKGCPLKMKTSVHDPMTDSDFFTESDADIHDDVGGAIRGGDRRAQVIDGTLYNNATGNNGGLNQQHQRCPSFTASINEEMESSGVYSDLERKPDECDVPLVENERKIDADCSPDGSTKTVSSKSEASQVKDVADATSLAQESVAESLDATLIENNARNLLVKEMPNVHEAMEIAMDVVNTTDIIVMPANVTTNSATPLLNDSKVTKKQVVMKKHPMPKRNVASKIKAMLEAPPTTRSGNASIEDVHQESLRRCSASKTPRPGRWDAVMSKIAQGQADEKLKPDRLKEVKSKVFAGIADGQTPVVGTPKRKLPTQSSSAKKENHTPLKAKSRRARSNRASSSSSVHPSTPGGGGGGGSKTPGRSVCSSQRSSLSDVSLNTSAQPQVQTTTTTTTQPTPTPSPQQVNSAGKSAGKPPTTHRTSKKQRDISRDVAARSASPNSDVSTTSATSHNVTPTRAAPLQQQGANNGHNRTPPGRPLLARESERPKSAAAAAPAAATVVAVGVVAKRHPPGAVAITSNKRLHLSTPSPPLPQHYAQEKNGAGVVPDMKTPLVRKPTSSRRNEKHKLQRDHNRLAGVNKPPAVESPIRGFHPGNDATSTPVVSREPPPPPPQVDLRQLEEAQQALEIAQAALGATQLSHKELEKEHVRCVQGFDAFTVLMHYVVTHYDAFSVPRLKKQLAETKASKNEATLALDEMSANLRRIEGDVKRMVQGHRSDLESTHEAHRCETEAVREECQQQIEAVRESCRAEIEAMQETCRTEIEALKEQHEIQLADVTRQHQAIQMANLAELQKKNKDANIQHEAELRQRQVESRKLESSQLADTDLIQVTSRQWRVQQDEVSSLRSVLDLRHGELQELRLKNSMLERNLEGLDSAQKKASMYKARVEDLDLQLKLKKDEESRFASMNQSLIESLHNESLCNKRLSQVNEELAWKLKMKMSDPNSLSVTTVPVSEFKHTSPPSGDTTMTSLLDSKPSDPLNSTVMTDVTAEPTSSGVLTSSYLERSESVAWMYHMGDETSADTIPKNLLKKSASFKRVNSPKSIGIGSPARTQSSPRNKPKHHCYIASPDEHIINGAYGAPLASSSPTKQDENSPVCSSTNPSDDSFKFVDVTGVSLHLKDTPEARTSSSSVVSSDSYKMFSIMRPFSEEVALVANEGETETVLPLVPLTGSKSSELALMAAQIPPVPKDAGGEAMISEETSEEDNSAVDLQSSDDESSLDIQ